MLGIYIQGLYLNTYYFFNPLWGTYYYYLYFTEWLIELPEVTQLVNDELGLIQSLS